MLRTVFPDPLARFCRGGLGGESGPCVSGAIMDALDIFTDWLPVAAKSLLASFNVHKMREAKQLDCVWFMWLMQGVEK